MKYKEDILVGISVLVGNVSIKFGVEMCVEVTVGMGFGAMNVDRFSCMDRVRRENQ